MRQTETGCDTPDSGHAAPDYTRGAVLVDGPSLHALAVRTGRRVAYDSLLDTLRQVLRRPDAVGLYYSSILPGADVLTPLFEMLSREGFHVVTQTAHAFSKPDGKRVVRGSVDVNLVLGAITAVESGARDVLLVTGTGGFAPLVEELRGRGARVTVLSSGDVSGDLTHPFVSRELVTVADEFCEALRVRSLWETPRGRASSSATVAH